MNKKNEVLIPIIVIVIGLLCFGLSFVFKDKIDDKGGNGGNNDGNNDTTYVGNYNSNLIKVVHEDKKGSNYLLSPYSIEIALDLLKEGANNDTLKELNKAVPERTFKDLNSTNVRISNATFINERYKGVVEKTFTDNLTNKYHAEAIVDNITPEIINGWAKEKTNGMIDKVVDQITPDFVFGVINAVALDLKFQYQFECNRTREVEFTKVDNTTMKVPMMNATYERNIKYVVNDEYSSIALPYKSEGEYNYELVAVLPKDLDGFINSLNDEKINNVMKDAKEANDKTNVYLSLPQFNYDFKLEDSDFIKVLNKLGINLAFDAVEADFSRFITRENMEKVNIPNMSVTKAVHKTFIDLNEVGTKAAAVTYFGVDKNEAVLEQPEVVRINFDKPFVYMIRETGTNEILFFGIVYEPKEWKGSTCTSIDREL